MLAECDIGEKKTSYDLKKRSNKIFTLLPAGKFVFKTFIISFIVEVVCYVVVCYIATHVEVLV